MKIWVGITDKNWYEHLIRLAPEDVNFWQPSEQSPRHSLRRYVALAQHLALARAEIS